MIASFLLLSHVAGLQPETITLREYGASVSSVVERIEKATGEDLSWDSELAREPVILKVTSRPPQEVMDGLADLLCAEWVEKDGKRHLQRDREDWDAHQKEETQMRHQAISDAKEAAAKGIKVFDWSTEDGAKSVRDTIARMLKGYEGIPANQLPGFGATPYNDGGASYEALQSLLRSLPPETFDSVPPEGSVVFSDRPNRLQKDIGIPTSDIAARFRSQQDIMIAAVKKELSLAAPDMRIFGGLYSAFSPKGGVKKLLLRITRPDARPAYRARLWVVDMDNNVCGQATVAIAAATSTPPESPITSTQSEPVPVRPDAEQLCINLAKCDSNLLNAALFAGGGQKGLGFSVLSAANPSYLELAKQAQLIALRPDENEPMGQLPGDYVLGLADAVGKDVMALLPDEAVVSSGRFSTSGRATPGRIAEWIRSLGCQIVLNGNRIDIEPMRPVEAAGNRTDRIRLTRFLEPFGRERLPRIGEMKDYIESGKITGILDRAYVRLFSQSIESTVFGSEISRATVLLVAPYVADPIKKGSTPINLNSRRDALDAILMSAQMAEDMEMNTNISRRMPGHEGDPLTAFDDPTEKYVGGLPREMEALLTAEVYDEFAVYDEANGRIDYLSGMSLTMRTRPEDGMTEGRQDVTLSRFRYYPARLSSLSISVPALNLNAGFFDIFIPDNTPPLSAAKALEIIKARGVAGWPPTP